MTLRLLVPSFQPPQVDVEERKGGSERREGERGEGRTDLSKKKKEKKHTVLRKGRARGEREREREKDKERKRKRRVMAARQGTLQTIVQSLRNKGEAGGGGVWVPSRLSLHSPVCSLKCKFLPIRLLLRSFETSSEVKWGETQTQARAQAEKE